jgi:hypothetical protein
MHAQCRAAGLEVLPKPIDPAQLEAFLVAAVE